MMEDTEVVVVEEDTTENADQHLITKVDRAMIDHAHVPFLHVSLTIILISILTFSASGQSSVVFVFIVFD